MRVDKWISVIATFAVFILICGYGGVKYPNFASTLVLGNLLTDNAFVIIAGVGMTLVILTGGIDLSVGSMIALVGVLTATLITKYHWNPLYAMAFALVLSSAFGALMGYLIDAFDLQPFIVTLSGMFFLRGLAFVLSLQSVPISTPLVDDIASFAIPLPGRGWLTSSAIIMLAVLVLGIVIAHFTRFGNNVYAIGGDRTSAELLGVPIRKTLVGVYAFSGFTSGMAGVVYTLYTSSGYPLAALGVELDVIASVVIGGTLLTGGVGFVIGTLFGGLIQGVIQTLITFDGSLNSWWTKIVIGFLLFIFIVLQRILTSSFGRASPSPA
ncbi:galactofuranose ABC transporter, permease protein YjfF [Celerinatantimonas sp. MCCC 1A17872]|uniref:galactofuranose ABC transporter, permease protein YjfF n=1 Tax=Celerinatantimonas sp. MCCC 1A17872 TaxID=3177514 RepID=UPI0038CA8631